MVKPQVVVGDGDGLRWLAGCDLKMAMGRGWRICLCRSACVNVHDFVCVQCVYSVNSVRQSECVYVKCMNLPCEFCEVLRVFA